MVDRERPKSRRRLSSGHALRTLAIRRKLALNLDEVQRQVDEWVVGTAGGYWDRFQILARLTEEVGEVAAALQRLEGLRPATAEVDLGAEIGDVLFTLAAFANVHDVSLADEFARVLSKYEARDATAWKKEGSSP